MERTEQPRAEEEVSMDITWGKCVISRAVERALEGPDGEGMVWPDEGAPGSLHLASRLG